MGKVIVLGLCALLVTPAQANGLGTGRITGWAPSTSGGNPEFVVLSVETITGTPPCNTTARFSISSTDPKYKTVVAGIIAAFHAGTPVRVFGLGTCNVWSNAEDVTYICFGNVAC